jgi:MFS family permease
MLFAGQAISAIGDRLVPVALAFAVLDLTGSVTDLGIVLAAQTVPLILFVLFGGVWADRLPRQRVMLASDCVRAIAQTISAALLLTGKATVWEIATLQALYGAAEAFFGPAATALVPQTVDPQICSRRMPCSGSVATSRRSSGRPSPG